MLTGQFQVTKREQVKLERRVMELARARPGGVRAVFLRTLGMAVR